MLSVNNVSVHFTGEYIFDSISFLINDRDRIGLVGRNGAGKTTLLRVIAGELEPETGSVASPAGQSICFLRQEMNPDSKLTVIQEARQAFQEVLDIESKIKRLTNEISNRTDYYSESYLNLVARLKDLNEWFDLANGHKIDENTEKVLLGLGFERKDFLRPLHEFSSGWQMRVELAKILLKKPDVLLLDEPTNHLDIEAIQWLEDFLTSYPGAIVLVSHDRAFLDNITNRTIEITMGKIFDYKASFSQYEQLQAERREREMASYNNQQQQIAQIERFIERFRYKNTKARQVQSRIKMLDKMDKIEIEETDNSVIRLRFPPSPHSGRVTLRLENLSKAYGEHLVLQNLNFSISRGEKIAFVGRNGEGKSTLAKVIVGELPYTGTLIPGHLVKIGYYAQNQHEMLDMERTVFETIDDVATGEWRTKVKGLLGSFLFRGDDLDKKVKVLSGGEKSRLSLARMLLTPVNFLILDEPTNHLDMRSKDILKSALLQYDGTLIIVSHDRDFLSGLTEKVFEFHNKGVKEYIGDVHDFLQSRKMEHLTQLNQKDRAQSLVETTNTPSVSKLDFERRKAIDRELRKLQNSIEKSEQIIIRLESDLAEYDALLTNPDSSHNLIKSGEIYHKYEILKNELATEMERWETLVHQFENFQQ